MTGTFGRPDVASLPPPFPTSERTNTVFTQFDDHRSGGFLQTAATVTAVAISALASFQFFASYSGALLSGLLPEAFLSAAAGLIGVVMLEGAALYWQRSLQHDADSQAQVQIARAGYLVSVILSVTVTMLYFVLSSSLVAPYMTEVLPVVNAFAALVLVGIVGFQFTAKMQYSGAATTSVEARQAAELRALQNTARYDVERETTRSDLSEALANIEKALPAASRKQGQQTAEEFLAARYGQHEATPARPTMASANGSK